MSRGETTRSDILKRALELIYRQGYQATSIDDILAATQVTKGAFYYHFRNKEEMGIALIKDAMHGEIWPYIEKFLSGGTDFRDNIFEMIRGLLYEQPLLTAEHGCPAVNLVQEMAPHSKAFRIALSNSLNKWKRAIEAEIRRGIQAGQLSAGHDASQTALNIITLYHGVRNMGKLLGKSHYASFLAEFRRYLDALE